MAEISTGINKHCHLIGIGGIGMSGIARLLIQRGMEVSGSDLKESKITQELKAKGAKIFLGHRATNVHGTDLVIYSSAINQDNPEIQEAKRQGIPTIKRAQALAELMRDKIVVTITGSHGKTTTVSLVSCLLIEAGLFPTIAVGGILKNIDSNAYLGVGNFFVAEADESDGSFLYYQPYYSIITNIDYEHLDYYKEFQNELNSFKEFLNRTEKKGCVFCCADDLNLINILKDYKHRYVLFGLEENADLYPKNITSRKLTSEFDCFYQNKFINRFYLSLGGMHNISNALSVIALGLELNIDLEIIKKALANYQGVCRRLEIKFQDEDFTIVDDYAHHPTEIKASLLAIKNLKFNRLIAIFQPHRYSRTKLLLDEFGRSFALADYVVVTDIYPAGEQPIEGISGESIYQKIKEYDNKNKEIYFLPKEDIVEHILKIIKAHDLIVTLGAGDIVRISDELVERFKRKS